MANGAFNFKNNSGNIVSFISGSDSDIIMSGGTLDLSSMTGITLGNLTLSGTSENATSASHAASYLLTSSFNTYSGTTDTVIGTLQTSTGSLNSFSSSTNNSLSSIETSTSSLNSFTSSATTRLSSIETTTGSLNSYTSSNNTRLGVIESTTGSLNSYTSSNTTNINEIHTSTSSLNSFTSSATTRLSSIEGVSGSYATTGSNQFKNDQVITGSLIVTGFIETQELRTTYISSSILFRSGSTKFGDELDDTHAFTGSLLVSGSISVLGSNLVSGSSQVLNGSGVFSGSAQLPSGIVSGSAQTIANLPSGTVSGSVQVDVMSTTNIARLATTGSNTFTGALNGTSAVFSGQVQLTGVNPSYLVQTSDNTGYAYYQIKTPSHDWSIGYDGATNFKISNGINPATSTRLTIASTGAATFSSSVTANARSFIKGSAGYLFDIEEQGANKARFQSYVVSNEISLVAGYDTTAIPMTFYTGNTERMRITSGGNVLLGTQDDNGARLQVSGSSRLLDLIGGGDSFARVTGNRGNSNDLHVANIEFYNSFSSRLVGEIRGITGTGGTQSNSGQLAFYTNNNGTYAERVRIISGGSINFNGVDSTTQYYFGQNRPDSTNLLVNGTNNNKIKLQNVESDVVVLNSNGNSYFNGGNVGIGTTSPVAKLEASYFSSANNVVRLVGGGGTTAGNMFLSKISDYSDTSPINLFWADHGGTSRTNTLVRIHTNETSDGGYPFRVTAQGSLTSPTYNALVVNYLGNVGIGTVSPGTQFVIEGSGTGSGLQDGQMQIRTTVAANPSAIGFINSGNTSGFNDLAWIRAIITAGSARGSLSFVTRDSDGNNTGVAERMRITSDGNFLVGATNVDVGGSVKGAIIRQNGTIVGATNISSPFHYQSPIAADRMNTMGDGMMYGMWRQGIFQAGIGATNGSVMTFFTGNNDSMTERMRITSGGTVMIGGSSGTLDPVWQGMSVHGINGSNKVIIGYLSSATNGAVIGSHASNLDAWADLNYAANNHIFRYQQAEVMRINSGGFLKASNTGTYISSSAAYHELNSNVFDDWAAIIRNSSASPYGLQISYGASPNSTANQFIWCPDGTALRFEVRSNGDVRNFNNSYGSLSDIKLKENIEDATPKLDDLLKVKIRNYNLIGDDKKQIGVIAQELEDVFPNMVDEVEDYEEVEVPQLDEEGNEVLNEEGEVVTEKQRVSKGTFTKSVKYSVFVPMLIKAIQELKTEIDSLKNQMQ